MRPIFVRRIEVQRPRRGRLRFIDGGRMVFLHGSVQSLTAGKGGQISIFEWRGGRVAEGGGLLNRYTV
jgi:hypothetical protein